MDQALVEPPRLSWGLIHRLLAYGPHFRTMTQDQVSAAWDFHQLDYRAFGDELRAIKRELDESRSEADFKHLRKIERWGRLCSAAGYATAWIVPNPISAFLISQGNFTRWTMVTHHVTHRGYDKTPGVPRRYTSKHYARGWRRFVDWLDWIVPDAWDFEHNVFHHYYTGEVTDPDLVERNVDFFRAWRLPIPIKAVVIAFFMCTWKLLYYAPSTIWILQRVRARNQKAKALQGKLRSVVPDDHRPVETLHLLLPINPAGREFWCRAILPYGLVRFVLTPLLFLPIGYGGAIVRADQRADGRGIHQHSHVPDDRAKPCGKRPLSLFDNRHESKRVLRSSDCWLLELSLRKRSERFHARLAELPN